jgi:hypothetical protein
MSKTITFQLDVMLNYILVETVRQMKNVILII